MVTISFLLTWKWEAEFQVSKIRFSKPDIWCFQNWWFWPGKNGLKSGKGHFLVYFKKAIKPSNLFEKKSWMPKLLKKVWRNLNHDLVMTRISKIMSCNWGHQKVGQKLEICVWIIFLKNLCLLQGVSYWNVLM